MTTSRRTALASGCLALALAAGCSSDTDSPDDGTDSAAGTPTATATSSPAPTATAAPPSDGDAAATFATLTGEATRLSVDRGVLDALGAIGVELTAAGGAQSETGDGATTFVFPVTGGQATVDGYGEDRFSGTVQHEGQLRLSALGRDVTVDGLVLDGDSDQLTAMVAGRRVPLLPLAGDARVTREGEQVVLTWSAASLDTSAVDELAGELGLPTLPDLQVNALTSTLEGS